MCVNQWLLTRYRSSLARGLLTDVLHKVVSIRAYYFDRHGVGRYVHACVHRYPLDGSIDIAIPPWDNRQNRRTEQADVAIAFHPGSPQNINYRVYFQHDNNLAGQHNHALAAMMPGVQWRGSLLVFRRAVRNRGRLVHLRLGEDARIVEAVQTYV